MKILSKCGIFATIAVTLVACTTPEQRAQRAAMIEAADHAECVKLGFRPKSNAYGDCRLRLKEMRSNERAARNAAPRISYGVGTYGHHGRIGSHW